MQMHTSKRAAWIAAAIAPVMFIAASAVAAPKVKVGDVVGVDFGAISAHFTQRGYEVREIEKETDKIEVEALADGAVYEFYLSSDRGVVTKVERDDD